jgi:hypothetical protein
VKCHAGPGHPPAEDRGASGALCVRCFAGYLAIVTPMVVLVETAARNIATAYRPDGLP